MPLIFTISFIEKHYYIDIAILSLHFFQNILQYILSSIVLIKCVRRKESN